MKRVTAIIQPFKLDAVGDALRLAGVSGLNVTEVIGFGHQKGHTEFYRGAEYTKRFVPKMKVEIAVPTGLVDKVIGAIIDSARTGQIGDGKIFVADIEQVLRIRTGETDLAAL
ncbi:MAG: P-II family nitrogen regulator [Methylocapsa sp.]|nr:P-II family nitrogen regulator [Methylocapsa sp.]